MTPRLPVPSLAVVLPPALDAASRTATRDAAIAALSQADGPLRLAGDGVATVAAAGLGVLVLIEKRARDLGRRVVLVRPSAPLAAILAVSQLSDLFDVEP